MGRRQKSITQRQLEVISGRVKYELYKKVETLAQVTEMTITQILRRALEEYVERHPGKKAA